MLINDGYYSTHVVAMAFVRFSETVSDYSVAFFMFPFLEQQHNVRGWKEWRKEERASNKKTYRFRFRGSAIVGTKPLFSLRSEAKSSSGLRVNGTG